MGERARRRFQEIGREFPAKVAESACAGASTPRRRNRRPGRYSTAQRDAISCDCSACCATGGPMPMRRNGGRTSRMTLAVPGPGWRNPVSGRTDRAVAAISRAGACDRRDRHRRDRAVARPRRPHNAFRSNPPCLLNGAVHLIDPQGSRPLGVVIEDERFVWRHWQTIAGQGAAGHALLFLDVGDPDAVRDWRPQWLALQSVHHLDFVHRPYGGKRPRRRRVAQPGLPELGRRRQRRDIAVAAARG